MSQGCGETRPQDHLVTLVDLCSLRRISLHRRTFSKEFGNLCTLTRLSLKYEHHSDARRVNRCEQGVPPPYAPTPCTRVKDPSNYGQHTAAPQTNSLPSVSHRHRHCQASITKNHPDKRTFFCEWAVRNPGTEPRGTSHRCQSRARKTPVMDKN